MLAITSVLFVGGFLVPTSQPRHALARCGKSSRIVCCAAEGDGDSIYDTAMKMKVSEIKAELDLRKISYDGLFEKEEMARLLAESRAAGRADPTLVDEFNKASMEAAFQADEEGAGTSPIDAAQAVASDGGLPGGMSPEKLTELTQNPEIMALLRNPRMQELMKLMMEGGPEAAQEAVKDDEELREMLAKVSAITGVTGK